MAETINTDFINNISLNDVKNIANKTDKTRFNFKITNKLVSINKIHTRHLYHVLKCNGCPKKPRLIIKTNITKTICCNSTPSIIPDSKISKVSATLNVMVAINFLFIITHHLPYQITIKNYSTYLFTSYSVSSYSKSQQKIYKFKENIK